MAGFKEDLGDGVGSIWRSEWVWDQVERHQKNTRVSALGDGAISQGEEQVCRRYKELPLQTRGVGELGKLSWLSPLSAGPAQPLEPPSLFLSLSNTVLITISGDFTSNTYLSML